MRSSLAALALTAVLAAPAEAATVRIEDRTTGDEACRYQQPECFFKAVVVEAAPGETNLLTVRGSARGLGVQDRGAPLTAGAGCTALDANNVVCSPARRADLRLGDGDDTTDVAGAESEQDGGRGNDRLLGGEQSDQLDGGDGADALLGRDGDDVLVDGDRAAPLLDDLLDGGDGDDSVSYADRTEGVRVDLLRRSGGSGGERDILRDLENAFGGTGDDRLYGDGTDNLLAGDRGDDELRGRGRDDLLEGGRGDDLLNGGPGEDQLTGNSGDDRFRLRDGRDDEAVGGSGIDLAQADRRDDLRSIFRRRRV